MSDLRTMIQEALNEGRIKGTVELDGETLSGDVKVGPAQFDPETGWSYRNISGVGGMMSRGVEQLRRDLVNMGHATLAAQLPAFHVGRWWQPPETYFGWNVLDPTRFEPPTSDQFDQTGITPEQFEQLQDNIINYDLSLFANIGMLGGTKAFAAGYRGQEKHKGWTPDQASGSRPIAMGVCYWTRTYPKDQDGNEVRGNRYTRTRASVNLTDHQLYDLWFDLRTDENITRYWQSWIRAKGVEV